MRDLFIEAAQIMDDPMSFIRPSWLSVTGSCSAIFLAAIHDKRSMTRARIAFYGMFKPEVVGAGVYWLGRPQENDGSPGDEENRSRRVFALLLAAEAWEDFV